MSQPQILSYAAGVQSRAIVRLILGGRLPKPDLALMVDVGAEPAGVMDGARHDQEALAAIGVELKIIATDLTAAIRSRPDRMFIPAFSMGPQGGTGMKKRWCTSSYKLEPMRRELVSRYGPRGKYASWIGISTDEATRAKPSRLKSVVHRFPLVELGLSRTDCVAILEAHGIRPQKSACVFCPYHSGQQWDDVRRVPQDRALAIEVDELLRNRSRAYGFANYLHRTMEPISTVFRRMDDADALEAKQPGLFEFPDLFDSECAGACAT